MLISQPIGAGEAETANWKRTNRMIVDIFNAYWKKVSPHFPMPGSKAGDEGSYSEWTDSNGDKCQGMRRTDGAKHGIVRSICNGRCRITEATYLEDKLHGLCFQWINIEDWAFMATIYNRGNNKAFIQWKEDWSETL